MESNRVGDATERLGEGDRRCDSLGCVGWMVGFFCDRAMQAREERESVREKKQIDRVFSNRQLFFEVVLH